MKKKFIALGLRLGDLETARARVERLLDIEMKGVNSHAYGGDLYYFESQGIRDLQLFQNWNAVDADWNRADYEDFDLLIEIDRLGESEAIEKKLIDDPELGSELLEESEY